MISSNATSGIMAGAPPPAAALRQLLLRLEPGDQVAEPLGAGDPGGVQERGQSEQVRDLGQPGGAQPAGVQPGQPASAGQ